MSDNCGFILDIEVNAEGNKLAILTKIGDEGSGYRLAGPKAWGGSRNIATLKFKASDLVRFITDYAPEIISMLNKKP